MLPLTVVLMIISNGTDLTLANLSRYVLDSDQAISVICSVTTPLIVYWCQPQVVNFSDDSKYVTKPDGKPVKPGGPLVVSAKTLSST